MRAGTGMIRYCLRRLLGLIPLVLVISSAVFVVGQYGAGDLAAYLTMQHSGGEFDEQVYARYRAELGLDAPMPVRYARWLGGAIRGDFGRSYVSPGEPEIAGLLARAMPITLQLALVALVMAIVLGLPVGVLAAVYRNSWLDRLLVSSSSILSTVPAFVLAPLCMIVVVNQLHLLPSVGLGWHGVFSVQILLPAFCLAAGAVLNLVRFTRASVLEVLAQDYIRAAHARGLPGWRVVVHHVLRNSLTPLIAVMGLMVQQLVGGALFIEAIFNLQGFGQLTGRSLAVGDIQTATACALVGTVIVLVANLVADIVTGLVDPRVRFS